MKKLGIIIIALVLVVVGMAMSDPGVPQVREVQGLATSTTVIAAGNFNAASNIQWTITSGEGAVISDLPPISEAGGVVYQDIYSEDTQNSEIGYISYDKDLDLTTANRITGQWNIQAVKQITYLGVDASSVITNDYLMLDSAGTNYGNIGDLLICPFGGDQPGPDFCNKIETGSSMNLKVANLNTQLGDRKVMKSSDPGIAMYNNVGVSSYASDLPSKGSVSAFIKGSIREGGRGDDGGIDDSDEDPTDLYQTLTFSDTTGMSGDISSFAKVMSYFDPFAGNGADKNDENGQQPEF